MTRFGLLRHGRTRYNAEHRYQGGGSDIPLDPVGRHQAAAAAAALPDRQWDRVISSPLSRAVQTAEIVSTSLDLPVWETEPRLREVGFGWAEGLPIAQADVRYPSRAFPGKESDEAAARRGYEALIDLAGRYPDESVLIMAHGTIIRYLASGVFGGPLASFHNCSLTVIGLTTAAWSVERIDDHRLTTPVVLPRVPQVPETFPARTAVAPWEAGRATPVHRAGEPGPIDSVSARVAEWQTRRI